MKTTIVAALLFFVAACGIPTPIQPVNISGSEMSFMRQTLANAMRNPDAAQFRNLEAFRAANGSVILCGEVNGTNGFGGFTGFMPMSARFDGPELNGFDIGEFGAIWCNQARSGTITMGV